VPKRPPGLCLALIIQAPTTGAPVTITNHITMRARDDTGATPRAHHERGRLEQRLETSYELHTRQLAGLTSGVDAMSDEAIDETLTREDLVTTSRQALADIASALRHMAEDRYGMCERCGEPIAIERLRARPEARFCVPCLAGRHRFQARPGTT